MKIAVLHHGDPVSEALWSGIPRNIVRTLKEQGHQVELVGSWQPAAPLGSRIKTQLYRHLLKKTYLINRDPTVIQQRAKDANARLKKMGPADAILITYPPNAAYLETDIPIVIAHDATWKLLIDYYPGTETSTLARETIEGGMELDKIALATSAHAVYCSQWAADSAIRDFGASASKVSVAPLGASLAQPPTREDVAAYLTQRGQQPLKMFFMGKGWYRKGGDIAVAVAEEIHRRGIPVELHTAGSPPESSVPPYVTQHGWLSKDDPAQASTIHNLFSTSDFFILPTRADAFGLVYAESAAYGLPVMATDTGGVKDAARPGWSLTPPLNTAASAYADWAIQLYQNRAAYEQAAWLARKDYEDTLNWPAFCNHVTSVIEQLR